MYVILDIMSCVDYYRCMIPWLPVSSVPDGYSPSETGAARPAFARYQRNLRIAFGVTVLSLVISWQVPTDLNWARVCVWLIYFAGLASVPITLVRYVATWDELQQRIFISAAAGAFLLTVVLLLLNAVLPKMGVRPIGAMELGIVPFAIFFVCHFIARKHYS